MTVTLVVAIAAPSTYAALVTNTVSLAGNTLSTASADLAICNANDDLWDNTLTSTFTVSDIAPGSTSALTTAQTIYIGNDGGSLDSNQSACSSYDAGYTAGNSAVDIQVVPTISNVDCGNDFSLTSQMQLEIVIGTDSTGYQTMDSWTFNSTAYGPIISPDEEYEINVNTQLADDFDVQGGSCTFDLQLRGRQI